MTRVLVVGASGRMGQKIATELGARGATVRVTRRAHSKPDALEALRASGAELVAADLVDADSLARACAGVDVVVSAVQGLRDVIVDGQTRLLRAAEDAGVARMIPSDYALDFFKTAPCGNRNLDLRREFNAALDASRVRGTSVLCGAFMDLIAAGRIGPGPDGTFRVWGDPDQPYDFTLTDDAARYVAAVALDDGAGRFVRVAGDTRSPRQLAAVFEEVRGARVTIAAAGSIDDLDRAIAGMRARDPAETEVFPVWQAMQYIRDMASGRGALAPLDNARYPEITPTTVRELLRR
jgi:nucleoside-diphosphate-sugar epimerase